MTQTVKQRIAMYLHGRIWPVTATDIWKALGRSGDDFKLSTVSSVLNKLVKSGVLCRVEKFGPRGGYGYLGKDREVLRDLSGIPKSLQVPVHDNPIAQHYLDHAGVRFEYDEKGRVKG